MTDAIVILCCLALLAAYAITQWVQRRDRQTFRDGVQHGLTLKRTGAPWLRRVSQYTPAVAPRESKEALEVCARVAREYHERIAERSA